MENFTVKVRDFIKMRKKSIREYYKIGHEIGKGAYGKIRWCIHKATGNLRAVKIIFRRDVEDLKLDLMDEIQILRQVDHPGIMKVFEFFSDKKRLFIVSELYTGGDLHNLITARQQLDE